MQDVFEIADRIVVIYQGQCVTVKEKEKTTIDEIASLIITGQGA
jgi:ABC-type sugar transport system ATPase subunit